MTSDYFWEGEPTQDIVVGCGSCGARRGFRAHGSAGALREARRFGWSVEFRPKPLIRCPTCCAHPLPTLERDGATHNPKEKTNG